MASNNGYLRSDTDKGEAATPENLRLRSDADKTPSAVISSIMTVTWANVSAVLATAKANIDEVMGISTS